MPKRGFIPKCSHTRCACLCRMNGMGRREAALPYPFRFSQ